MEEKAQDVDRKEYTNLEIDQDTVPVKTPLSRSGIFFLNLSWFGLNFMFLVLTVEVVPSQIQAMVGQGSKGRWLGAMVASGAVLTFVSGLAVGMASDRLVSKHGRRRPIMLGATIALCLGLVGMAISAPTVIVETPSIGNSTECVVDLVARRCAPFKNNTLNTVIEKNQNFKDSLFKRGYETYGKHMVPQQGLVVPGDRPNQHAIPKIQGQGVLGLYILFYLVVSASYCCVSVPYNGLIADKSHPDQRGVNSGVMGFMILFGNICGASLGLLFVYLGVFGTYGVVISVLFFCVLTTCVMIPEEPSRSIHPEFKAKDACSAFIEPLRDSDFRWVFITRFLMQQGLATVTGFLEYWLSDMVNLPNCWTPQTTVAVLLVPLLATAAISSVIMGYISDYFGRRKPFVSISAIVMCGCSLTLAFVNGKYAFVIAAIMSVFFGSSFGTFQAIDFALVMDVLPEDKDTAKDMAVWHLALVLPQALAVPVGGFILDIFEKVDCVSGLGYILLFLITGAYFMLSGVFVTRIKRVK